MDKKWAVCHDCGRRNSCVKATHPENYLIGSGCMDFVSEELHKSVVNKGKHSVPTFDEFSDIFKGLSVDQEKELIQLYDKYLNCIKKQWDNFYTFN